MRFLCLLALIVTLTSCSSSRYQTRYEDREIAALPMVAAHPKKVLIAIDPGHGGKDEGSHAKNPHYQEKVHALNTALLLKKYLESMGYDTMITRGDDTFIPLKARSCFANSNQSEIFVSVHYNAAENKAAHGIEVFYYKSDKDPVRSATSKVLADIVLEKVVGQTGGKSRGVKHGNLSVIRETKMPAILVEGGFLTNEAERAKIQTADYNKRVAWGIAVGIRKFLEDHQT